MDRASAVIANLGRRFDAHAVHVAEHIELRGIEPRLGNQLPVVVEVAPSGCAVLLRGGAVVFFGVEPARQEPFITELGTRLRNRYERRETEHVVVRMGPSDTVEADAVVLGALTIEALQVVADILGKSVILARHEQDIAVVFTAIEPLAVEMKRAPKRLPWKQTELVHHIGSAMLAQHQLVGSAELLEKPDLLWDSPQLDRFYKRLEVEYELRERHLALDRKLSVVSQSAQTMLDLHQARRSLNVEYYIVGLILFEIVMGLFELARK